jgi:hypothetical protein
VSDEQDHEDSEQMEELAEDRPPGGQTQGKTELVSEDEAESAIDEVDSPEQAQARDFQATLAYLHTVAEELAKEGVRFEIATRQVDAERSYIQLDLQLNGDARIFHPTADDFFDRKRPSLAGWKSLPKYDGIWNAQSDVVEVAVRSDTLLTGPRVPAQLGGESGLTLHLTSPGSSAELQIGLGSEVAGLLALGSRFRRLKTLTLTLRNCGATDETSAEKIVERIADSLFHELELRFRIHLSLSRLERRFPSTARGMARRRERQDVSLVFPDQSYPHEAMMLYRSAHQRVAPLIRYWAYYQVLEYFFPRYSLEDARKRLSQVIRDPLFDRYNENDVTKAVQAASSNLSNSREEEQLKLTIASIVDESDIRDFIETDRTLANQLSDKHSEVSHLRVTLHDADVRSTISSRIYDIRCQIVHNKREGGPRGSTGLIPGSHHEDLVRVELPLIEYLAQRALVAGSERLVVPEKTGRL